MSFLLRTMLINNWKNVAKSDAARKAGLKLTPGVTADKDLPYLDDGHPLHLLDIWYPQETTGLLPCVIDIHGGGWMYGDKNLNDLFCASLAAQGYAVVTMSYRLMPETDLRGMLQDVFASLHWLAKHGQEHHCDLSRVYLTGDSAGGHLCGLTTCVQLNPALQRVYGVHPADFDIKAIAINHGVCDLYSFGFMKGIPGWLIDREMHLLMFGSKRTKSEVFRSASFKDTARGLKLPPVMVISSEPDPFFFHSQALADYLRDNGFTFQTKFWKREQGEKLTHVFNICYPDWPESIETNREMLAFFSQAG